MSLEADGEVFKIPIEVYIDANFGRRNAFGESNVKGFPQKLFTRVIGCDLCGKDRR